MNSDRDSEEKSDEQFYSSVDSRDEKNAENINVDMKENATDKDPDKNPYNAKTNEENPPTTEMEFNTNRTPNVDNFTSAYVSIPSAEGLNITIMNNDILYTLRQNIMGYKDASGPDLSEDENQIPVLNQTIVEPIVHVLPEQPKELTLPDGITQLLEQKRAPPKTPTFEVEPKPKPSQEKTKPP